LELGALGFEDPQISKATKMHRTRIVLLRQFPHLPASLQHAVRAGEISTRLATRLLKLSPIERARAAKQYEETGALTDADVDAARRVSKQAAVDALPSFLFELPKPPSNSLEAVMRTMLETMDIDDLRTEFERILLSLAESSARESRSI
jgi:hypothetical protein